MCELAACIASDSAEFLKLLGMCVKGYEAQKLMSLLKEKMSLFSDWHNLQGQEGWHLAIIGHHWQLRTLEGGSRDFTAQGFP